VRRSWRQRLRSPTLREIGVAVAAPLLAGLIAFVATEIWKALHKPAPTGTIAYKGAVDAFVSRDDFYRRFLHEPAPPSSVDGNGVVFLVRLNVQHASSCRFTWTAKNVRDQQTVGDLVDQPANDVAGGTRCGGEKRLWLPWPCVPSETRIEFEIDLVAGPKQVDSATTDEFTIGGSC
jgi:hypothetical protein